MYKICPYILLSFVKLLFDTKKNMFLYIYIYLYIFYIYIYSYMKILYRCIVYIRVNICRNK